MKTKPVSINRYTGNPLPTDNKVNSLKMLAISEGQSLADRLLRWACIPRLPKWNTRDRIAMRLFNRRASRVYILASRSKEGEWLAKVHS